MISFELIEDSDYVIYDRVLVNCLWYTQSSWALRSRKSKIDMGPQDWQVFVTPESSSYHFLFSSIGRTLDGLTAT